MPARAKIAATNPENAVSLLLCEGTFPVSLWNTLARVSATNTGTKSRLPLGRPPVFLLSRLRAASSKTQSNSGYAASKVQNRSLDFNGEKRGIKIRVGYLIAS